MMMIKSMRNRHQLPLQIDRLDLPGKETDSLKQLAHGVHDIAQIEIAGGDLVQHRSEEKKVVAVHQRYLDIGIAGQCVVEV